jgi:hypothetical protein
MTQSRAGDGVAAKLHPQSQSIPIGLQNEEDGTMAQRGSDMMRNLNLLSVVAGHSRHHFSVKRAECSQITNGFAAV